MVLRLEAFLRPTDLLAKERHLRAAWLPPNETLKETVEFDDSGELAREIFHRWVRKIRTAAPALHQV